MSAVLSPRRPLIRPMREADLLEVMKIERASYEFPWTEAIFRDCLRAGYDCRVSESNAGLLGYGIMSVGAGECHLLNICIHPDYRLRGFATMLIHGLLEAARRRRAWTVSLEVRVSNDAAYHLYRHLGFSEVGLRKGYYPARVGREDALVLARDVRMPLPISL